MEHVTGIGGVCFRAKDPAALARWYHKHRGVAPTPSSYDESPWMQEAGPTAFASFPDDPFGDRAAKLLDPSGHEWMVATRLETISPAEMLARFGKFFGEVPSDQLGPSPS